MCFISYRDPVWICEYPHVGRDGSSFLRLYSTAVSLGTNLIDQIQFYPVLTLHGYSVWMPEVKHIHGILFHLSAYFTRDVKGNTDLCSAPLTVILIPSSKETKSSILRWRIFLIHLELQTEAWTSAQKMKQTSGI